MKPSKVRGRLLLLAAIGMVAVSLVGPGVSLLLSGSLNNRALTVAQMDAVFGDGTDLCKKSYNCKTSFKSGDANCGYCDSGASRTVCCKLGDETSCSYQTTGGSPCLNAPFMVGAVNGPYGTCDTCTAASYRQSGNCGGIRNATAESNNCP
jgi:hypothetical protein